MGFLAEVQIQVCYIVCRFYDGKLNDLKNHQKKQIFSKFISLMLAIFSVCVLEFDKIFYFLCWSSFLYSGGTVVKVLCHKSEGRWLDPSWCHWNFSLT